MLTEFIDVGSDKQYGPNNCRKGTKFDLEVADISMV
jgi:hypothetical protein